MGRKSAVTKFPLARIKKVMQNDEEVGKIAANVPVVVSRALELFMQDIIEKSTDITRARGGKILQAGHVKECVTSNERFDFLSDIVEKVQDAPAAEEGKKKPRKRKAKEEGSSSAPAGTAENGEEEDGDGS
eukprot:tig00000655_g2875.t1